MKTRRDQKHRERRGSGRRNNSADPEVGGLNLQAVERGIDFQKQCASHLTSAADRDVLV